MVTICVLCIDGVDTECSGSMEGDCIPSQFLKPYLMYSANDVVSATVDFAKGNVDDGGDDNPPSCSVGRTSVYSPSPLQGGQPTSIRWRSCS
jgi:hypothetical protein